MMDCAWLSFIYKLDRGYFAHVLAACPVAPRIAKMIPVLGAALGITMSFSPALMVVPIAVGGLFMAALLLCLGSRPGGETQFKRTNRDWGQKTFLTCFFVACLILPHWFMVADEPAFVAARQVMDGFLGLARDTAWDV
jgi:hypothetical protein